MSSTKECNIVGSVGGAVVEVVVVVAVVVAVVIVALTTALVDVPCCSSTFLFFLREVMEDF